MKMMNKLLSAAAAFLTAVSVFTAFPVCADELQSAEDVLQDGAFIYEVNDGSYTITKCIASIVTEIPAIRNGVSITAIGEGMLYFSQTSFGPIVSYPPP